MANVHIKSEERRQHEAYVLESFRKSGTTTGADREAAETVAARSREAYENLKKMEGNKR